MFQFYMNLCSLFPCSVKNLNPCKPILEQSDLFPAFFLLLNEPRCSLGSLSNYCSGCVTYAFMTNKDSSITALLLGSTVLQKVLRNDEIKEYIKSRSEVCCLFSLSVTKFDLLPRSTVPSSLCHYILTDAIQTMISRYLHGCVAGLVWSLQGYVQAGN